MTRAELITALQQWRGFRTAARKEIRRRDDLQFALWWYGRSTEADKPNPQWPDDDYVAAKTGGGPRYLESIDDALGLVPPGHYWLVGAGRVRPDEPLYGAQVIDRTTGNEIAGAESDVTPAHAVCIAAIKARAALAKAGAA